MYKKLLSIDRIFGIVYVNIMKIFIVFKGFKCVLLLRNGYKFFV